MVQQLALAFALFWGIASLATGAGLAAAIVLGGNGLRRFFVEATGACGALLVVSIIIAMVAP